MVKILLINQINRNKKSQKNKFLLVSCTLFVILCGCSTEKGQNPTAKDTISHETNYANTDSGTQVDTNEDMVPSPINFEHLNTVRTINENGISYYNISTSKESPLPLNEWAKLDILAENGLFYPAYIRFTNVTRNSNAIEDHMKQYMKTAHSSASFYGQPSEYDEYVLMDYDILIGKDASADKTSFALSAVRFPLRLYSTMQNETFANDHLSIHDRENLVTDVSISDTDQTASPGTTMKKTILCSLPKNYTAYGMIVPYINTQGSTSSIFFKLEY